MTTVAMSTVFFSGQAEYLAARGFEIHAVSAPGETAFDKKRFEPVTTHTVPMSRSITPFSDVRALWHLYRLFRRLQPAIVHSHTPKAGLLGMLAGCLARVPLRIYHVHGLPLLTAPVAKRTLLRCTEMLAAQLSHQVLCVSESVRQLMVQKGLCSANKVKVLLNGSINGIDAATGFNPHRLGPKVRHQVRRAWGIPREALVIGFVGRLVKDKGIAELIEAWRIVAARFPNVHLLLVGPFESHDPLPAEQADYLRSGPRVHLAGVQWNTPPFYRAMDVFCLPSHREGFGVVLLEAAAMELPSVAARIPGCVDSVDDGRTGTLVPARDAEALATAIQRYLEDPDLRHQHGRTGRERVLRDFQREAMWEATYQEYERLLHRQ